MQKPTLTMFIVATFLVVVISSLLITQHVNAQTFTPAPTDYWYNQICTCSQACAKTSDPLRYDASFQVRIEPRKFSRYAFRGAVASKLGIGRYTVIDREATNKTYAFGFAPSVVAKLTSKRVCEMGVFYLRSVYACCISNVTNIIDEAAIAAAAETEKASHRLKLIIAWVILGAAGIITVVLQRRDAKGKDHAAEGATAMALELDDDEKEDLGEEVKQEEEGL